MCNCIERLIKSGFSRDNAAEICKCYLTKSDEEGLESFVSSCEQYDPMHVKEAEPVGVQL